MVGRRRNADGLGKTEARPFPLRANEWHQVQRTMQLTPKEAAILELLLCGCCDKQIAMSLNLALATVRTHLRHVFDRQRVDSRVQLVLRIFEIARSSGDIITNDEPRMRKHK